MNTRWRPTPYRDFHVGHIPSAYDCWTVAKSSGGKFVLLVDDLCYGWQNLWAQSWSLAHAAERYAADLAWIGCPPDEVVFSTRNAEAHAAAAEQLGLSPPGRAGGWWTSPAAGMPPPVVRGGVRTVWGGAGYHEYYTMCKCVDDHEAGIQAFSRGGDLLYEAEAYDTMWHRLYPAGFPPLQRYVPTICVDAAKMSKSGTNAITIRDLRDAGYTGRQVLDTMLVLLETTTAARVSVPSDVLTTDRVAALERNLSAEWQGCRDRAAELYGDGQWGMDAVRVLDRIAKGNG